MEWKVESEWEEKEAEQRSGNQGDQDEGGRETLGEVKDQNLTLKVNYSSGQPRDPTEGL